MPPPPTEDSWHPTRLIRVGVVATEVVFQDEMAGGPRSHCRTVPLPLNQELELSSPSTDIQDALDSDGRPPHPQYRGEAGARMERPDPTQ